MFRKTHYFLVKEGDGFLFALIFNFCYYLLLYEEKTCVSQIYCVPLPHIYI